MPAVHAGELTESVSSTLSINGSDFTRAVLHERVEMLYRGTFAVPVNLVNAVAVTAVLWFSHPHPVLLIWLAATAAVVGARLALRRQYLRIRPPSAHAQRWALYFTAGTLASGLMWGLLCLNLLLYGQKQDFVLMVLVAAGMSAGALTTLAPYLPAFLGYAATFILPLSFACLTSGDAEIVTTGALMLPFIAIIGFAALNANRSIERTIQLGTRNAALNRALTKAISEKNNAEREKWTTLAHLSHELRTPLNAILGFSDFMRNKFFGAIGHPKYAEYADHIHGSGSQLLNLVEDILELCQGEAGQLQLAETQLDVAAVLQTCVEAVMPLAETAGLRLTSTIPQTLPQLYADGAKLRRIVCSLLSNAVKFTATGGNISVSASLIPDGGIAIAVSDTGIGISPEDIPRVTEPFVRLSTPLVNASDGAGLGLAICKRLAEAHSARLEISSVLGVGTSCRIEFPPWRSVTTDSAHHLISNNAA